MKKIIFLLLLLTQCLLAKNFVRIVSLGPYITENLYLLGIKDEIVGVTIHETPEIKKGKTIIGTLLEPNIEAIAALKPDIVLASKEGNRKISVEKIKKLGIRVETLDEVKSFSDLNRNFIRLGKLFGMEKEAKDIVANIKTRLENVSLKGKGAYPKVFWQLGIKPIITVGRDTLYSELISVSGGINLFGDIKRKYISVSAEEVVKRNPDIIIVVGMGEKEEAVKYWQQFPVVKAVSNNRVFYMEDTQFCSPTPQTYLENVLQLIPLFNK